MEDVMFIGLIKTDNQVWKNLNTYFELGFVTKEVWSLLSLKLRLLLVDISLLNPRNYKILILYKF